MRALILSAGLGKRLKPLTDTTPKPLIEVGGKPVIQHIIDKLHDVGIRNILINVHHLPEKMFTIKDVVFSYEPELLGEGETITHLGTWLVGDEFFVINGDTLSEVNLRQMCQLVEEKMVPVRQFGTNLQHSSSVYAGYSIYPRNWFSHTDKAPFLFRPETFWIDMGTPEGLDIARKRYG